MKLPGKVAVPDPPGPSRRRFEETTQQSKEYRSGARNDGSWQSQPQWSGNPDGFEQQWTSPYAPEGQWNQAGRSELPNRSFNRSDTRTSWQPNVPANMNSPAPFHFQNIPSTKPGFHRNTQGKFARGNFLKKNIHV
ncbi:unnamed protein product [Gongylonema pulchrum]|uniref:BAT2_N domain-containing protein n=1 Tax=Gongylonema pulchrum TaxID=637853 RepID=A0A183EM14_9BILA|nr:unnamed protein product [Gongylonema pulchrum]